MEVRHIVLQGTNEEIGKAVGDIAQEWLNAKPSMYKNPLYADANKIYQERNYPILAQRIKGLAKSYGIKCDYEKFIIGALFYDLFPIACSAAFYPAKFTQNNHNMICHNLDYFPITFNELTGLPQATDNKLMARSYVMEFYPDKGYASIGIGSMDLLNALMSGMNSQGLVIEMLADSNSPKILNPKDIEKSCGLIAQQLIRLILDTCSTVEEAKIAFLNNKIVFSIIGLHFQVSDKNGNSTIIEIDPVTFRWHFRDNRNAPQIITNHPVYLNPDVTKFKKSTFKHYSFNRYKLLSDYINSHKGKFSKDDMLYANSLVYGTSIDQVDKRKLPVRTMWNVLYDSTERTMEAKFYLKDGKYNPKTGEYELTFSVPFKFKLSAN
jgi:predicted choloylglycine hydrolase